MTDHRFEIPDNEARELARYWLSLGIAALIGAGLLAILLVLSRTPGIQDVFPLRDFFKSALVVHVDLSVLIWFMAFGSVMWSLAGGQGFAALGRVAFGFAAVGTAIMTISPFFPDANPLLNNYIPVLQQGVFFAGISLAGLGFACALIRALLTIRWSVANTLPLGADSTPSSSSSSVRFAVSLSAVAGATAIAGVVFALIYSPALEGQAFWEAIFWGGGHALQFQHTLLMVVAWFWLASELGWGPTINGRTAMYLYLLAAVPILFVPVIYAIAPVGSAWHTAYFARLMEYGHTLMVPLILIVLPSLWRLRGISTPAKSALVASFFLFATGGVLAYMIKGVNVVIPAHYHGSIVGVTLAFMGLTYVLLPRLGYASVEGRMARWQPYVYGGGQLTHILGLAWSGGYGVQRKVAGAEQILTTLPQKIGMGMMGIGGLISIIGGIMFVLICLIAMRQRTTRT
ncbi:MAG: cbb3-type cytochrome c oxidase subunit I [Rhodocyclaceae bacterium]|nr:cbb3-type cytochrome c oxidase subunit I [Rhodocyclaceae bacterium]